MKIFLVASLFILGVGSANAGVNVLPPDCHELACQQVEQFETFGEASADEVDWVYEQAYNDCAN
ncbi:MAG: hypothetical protein ACSHW4_01205 [Cellulophaga sp.]|uniref:hypothetical protein n=1 Tax=unclassified Cellulophaga TaxID=2634405 RepID=UPI0026E4672C|nr:MULTISPECIES: hypothetical protein [unclassified Cellulophaga]MDO6491192.1 hypothetical protein [Cellulophaga sp. 2_MG-2023]MDO6495275.1 hypothetical protein [Cellulophaga sp. 3_MG-2023]